MVHNYFLTCLSCILFLEAQLSNISLMDRLQDYEQLKEENKYLDMEIDEQAKNYVNLRKGCS